LGGRLWDGPRITRRLAYGLHKTCARDEGKAPVSCNAAALLVAAMISHFIRLPGRDPDADAFRSLPGPGAPARLLHGAQLASLAATTRCHAINGMACRGLPQDCGRRAAWDGGSHAARSTPPPTCPQFHNQAAGRGLNMTLAMHHRRRHRSCQGETGLVAAAARPSASDAGHGPWQHPQHQM
jgi:hypothetical protein